MHGVQIFSCSFMQYVDTFLFVIDLFPSHGVFCLAVITSSKHTLKAIIIKLHTATHTDMTAALQDQ